MTRQVLFLNVVSNRNCHLSIAMELMKDHMDAGDEVFSLSCSGALEKGCGVMEVGNPNSCKRCLCRYYVGMQHIKFPEDHQLTIKEYPCPELPVFADNYELKNYTLEGINLGFGAMNSYIFYNRDYDGIVTEHMALMKRFIHAGYVVMKNLKELLLSKHFDLVYIFNGRLAEGAAAVGVCKQLGIDFILYECGSTKQKCYLVKNDLFHRKNRLKREIVDLWGKNSNLEEKRAIAISWFDERQKRSEENQGYYSFTKEQSLGSLPLGFDSKKENISIFNSSADEYVMFDDFRDSIADQNILIRLLVEHFKSDLTKHFYLRVHPNLKFVNSSQMRDLKQIQAEGHKNLTIIWGDSQVDSYQLVRDSNKVITFGSTMGAEAVYMGVPSILASTSIYEDMGCCYVAHNIPELYELVEKKLYPIDKEKVLPFGYWNATFGQPLKYYKGIDFVSGTFQGVNLDAIAIQLSQSV